jgi:hypothetical protein
MKDSSSSMRQWAIAIIIGATVVMIIPILGLLDDPIGLLRDYWKMYSIFVILPFGISGILLYLANRHKPR